MLPGKMPGDICCRGRCRETYAAGEVAGRHMLPGKMPGKLYQYSLNRLHLKTLIASIADESQSDALSTKLRSENISHSFVFLKSWAVSSAGSEHLPYKQGVGGSNPSLPTPAARVAELADAPDSKSGGLQNPCGFDSRLLHTNPTSRCSDAHA